MMKSYFWPVILSIILFGGISSCKWDSEEELFDNTSCDTTDVRYSLVIKPILEDQCVGCHNAGFMSGDVNLETHKDVLVYVKNGLLMGTIKHEPGFSPMPKGGQKFSDCQIQQLQAWINKGSPND